MSLETTVKLIAAWIVMGLIIEMLTWPNEENDGCLHYIVGGLIVLFWPLWFFLVVIRIIR